MPRPKRCRRICCMPNSTSFGPLDKDLFEKSIVVMTVDEFEAIRLIDLEGLSQEECSERMNVARTTAQSIYNSARGKLAECLVNGLQLTIGGGDYVLCNGIPAGCGHYCKKKCHWGNTDKEAQTAYVPDNTQTPPQRSFAIACSNRERDNDENNRNEESAE